ncbi:MAG: Amuc_1099 family pilus-like system protein [Akkermansiaceae bacterium]
MSWFSENYEKAILGGAAVIAAGLGFLVFKGGEDPFVVEPVKQNNDVSVPGVNRMTKVKQSLAETHIIHQADMDGRKVNLFTGVALYSKKGDAENPVDLLKSNDVHPGISNQWWLKYGIDPGFSDSPERDPDEDGFTNREEHDAETDPTDFKANPNPISKLKLVDVSKSQVHIKPQDFGNNQFMFKLESKGGAMLNRMSQLNPKPIGPGAIIPFERPLMKDRFKFLNVEEKKNDRTGAMDRVWLFEDQKPNKKGEVYRFDSRGNLGGLRNRARGIMDSKVKLLLQALKQGGNPFEIEEGTSFSLPFDPKAKEKPYFLKKIDLDSNKAEVEYTDKDGKKQVHEMPFK